MRIKIVSTGDPFRTKLIDADTGADITGMHISRIVLDVKEGITATLTAHAVLIDLTTEFTELEQIVTLSYDQGDIDSIERAIAELQRQRAARVAS